MSAEKKMSSTMRIDIAPESTNVSTIVPPGSGPQATRQPDPSPAPVWEPEFQQLLNTIYDAVVVTDMKGVILDANERAVQFLQRPRELLHGSHLINLLSGADITLLATIQANLKGNRFTLIQAYCQRLDGSLFPAEISTNILHLDGKDRLCFFIRDITLRKEAEVRLRTEHNAIQNTGTGIAITDLRTEVVYANPALLSILGNFALSELSGTPLMSFFPAGPTPESLAETITQDMTWTNVVELQRQDGSTATVQLTAGASINTDNEVEGIVFSVLDITDKRKAEQELMHAMMDVARMSGDLQEFTYVISHDLQEPLRKICAFGDVLKDKCGETLSSEGQDYVQRMQKAAHRMQSLITALLDLSRISTRAQPFARVDLTACASEAIESLDAEIRKTGASVALQPLPTIDAEADQMTMLFVHLIGNAIKFCRPDVAPRVGISGSVVGQGNPTEQACEIIITDNGIGLDEQFVPRVFSVFQRLHSPQQYGGTGIGLALCKKIASRHGGEISVKSQPGKGASFTLQLPVVQQRDASGEITNG